MRKIYFTIRKMGITAKYKGYHYVAEAVQVLMDNPDSSVRITKDVYPILARKFRVSPENIEHNIRTVVAVCWNNNKTALDHVAGYELLYKPTNSDFIDMLAFYLDEDK